MHRDREGTLAAPLALSAEQYHEVRDALARGDHAAVARLLARARARHSDSETPAPMRWVSEPGACPACAAKSGRIVPPGGRVPPLHPFCRCSLAPADDAEPYASYQVTTEPNQTDYESMTITHGDRREEAPNMKNATTTACACEHRDSEADAAAALRKRLAGAWRDPDPAPVSTPARGSAPAPSAVGTDERAVMAAFRARLANAWKGNE
jgi:hypothetical protein